MFQDSNFQSVSAMAGVVGQVGCLVIFLIGLALGAGMFLDRYLDTGGIFTVIFLVGSVPVALYLTIRVSMRAAVRVQEAFEKQQAEKKAAEEAGETSQNS